MKTKSTYKSCDFVANIKISGCGDAFAVTRFVNTLSDMLIKYQGVLSNEEAGEGLEGDGDADGISVSFLLLFGERRATIPLERFGQITIYKILKVIFCQNPKRHMCIPVFLRKCRWRAFLWTVSSLK